MTTAEDMAQRIIASTKTYQTGWIDPADLKAKIAAALAAERAASAQTLDRRVVVRGERPTGDGGGAIVCQTKGEIAEAVMTVLTHTFGPMVVTCEFLQEQEHGDG